MKSEILNALIAKVKAHQDALGFSDEKFVARYVQFLGSAKTWSDRLKKSDLTGIKNHNVFEEKWISILQRLSARIDKVYIPETVFEALPVYRAMSKRLEILKGQTNDRRNVICLMPFGSGKSVFCASQVAKAPAECCYVRCHPGMRENGFAFASAVAEALGVTPGRGQTAAIKSVSNAIQTRPQTVFLDEFHEVGIVGFKDVRFWIDEAQASRFFMTMYPTDYDAVVSAQAGAAAEAKQLLRRTIRPIFESYRNGVLNEDIAVYLKLRASWKDEDCKICADRIGGTVRANGNFSVLEDAIKEAIVEAAGDGDEPTPDLVAKQLDRLCPAPVKRGGER